MPESNQVADERLAKHRAYYDRFADKVAARTEARDYTAHLDAFCARLPAGARVLDIGCGSGIHLRLLRERGLEPIGVEPSAKMRELAAADGFQVVDGSFENLSTLDLPPIQAVWSAASLLHVPQSELPRALTAVAQRLPTGGPFFLTVRTGSQADWDRYDDTSQDVERLIQLFEPEPLIEALSDAGFRIDYRQDEMSTWGRPSPWLTLIVIKL